MNAKLLAFAAAGTFFAISASSQASAVVLTGTIKVVCTITTDATLPAGTSFSLNANARGSGTGDFQTVSTSATAKKTGNSQVVTLMLPYKWALTNPQKTVPIFVTISAGIYPSFSSASTSLSVPLPKNGATTTVAIPARI